MMILSLLDNNYSTFIISHFLNHYIVTILLFYYIYVYQVGTYIKYAAYVKSKIPIMLDTVNIYEHFHR